MIKSQTYYHKLIDELLCADCKDEYCFLKVLLESLHIDGRVLIQLKCIEKFKYEESEKEGFDIGWNEAGMRWADLGYAEAFRNNYQEDLSFIKIYNLSTKRVDN